MRDYIVRGTCGRVVTVAQMSTSAITNLLDEYDRGLRDGPMVNNPDVAVPDMLERLRIELVARALPENG